MKVTKKNTFMEKHVFFGQAKGSTKNEIFAQTFARPQS